MKRPDEVIVLFTFDLAPLASGSDPVGHRDAKLINQQGQHVIKQGLPREDPKQAMCVLNGQAACQSTTFVCTALCFLTSLFASVSSDRAKICTLRGAIL